MIGIQTTHCPVIPQPLKHGFQSFVGFQDWNTLYWYCNSPSYSMLLRADLYPLFSPFLWVPLQGHRSRTDCFYSLLTQVPVDFLTVLVVQKSFCQFPAIFRWELFHLYVEQLCVCVWFDIQKIDVLIGIEDWVPCPLFCHFDKSPPSQYSWSVIFCEFYTRLIIILWLFINLFSWYSFLPCVILIYSSTFLPVHRLPLVMVSSLCYRLYIYYPPFIY